MAGGSFGGGTGTELDPYLVEDAADFNAVRNNLTAYYKQTADIDLSIYPNWEPIGIPFMGNYDCDNREINNPTISSSETYLSVFGVLVEAVIKNIKIKNANISGTGSGQLASILASVMVSSIVDACYLQGSVIVGEGSHACGVATTIEGGSVVSKCGTDVTVEGETVAAFATYINSSTANDCYGKGHVRGYSATESALLGGMFCDVYSGSVVSRCYAATTFANHGEIAWLGGFAVHSYDGTINDCYYDYDLSGQSDNGIGIPKTTVQMKQQATFTGWDFTDIWKVDEGESYPYFIPVITLTIAISGVGTTDPEVGTYSHIEGDVVELSATAGEESRFVNWEGNVSNAKSANTTIVIGTTDETVIAVFMPGGFNANLAGIITKDIKPLTFKRASHTDSKQSADAVNDNFRQVSTYTGTVTKTLKQYNQNLGTLNGNIEEIRQILIDAGIIV